MPRKGHPVPAPRALKLLKGTRPDRVNDDEPVPRPGRPEPPEDLTSEARKVWDWTLDELDELGVLAKCDRDPLVAYVEAVATHRKASRLLAKSDVLIIGQKGNPVRNPAISVQRDAAYAIRMFAQEFGLTPSGRTRIALHRDGSEDDSDNPFSGVG